uniref:AGC-kinase C-terminal domain-containing protein n=1 Tax=Catharus ustulatus TaxID=91951 RepID=A0A8C3V8V2_CATUS
MGAGTWGGVTAQKQNLELPLSLNQRLREPAQYSTSWPGSGNVRLQCQYILLTSMSIKYLALGAGKTRKSKDDVSNFDPDFIKEEPILTPIEEGILPMINQDEFRNFSFTSPELVINLI